MYGESNWVLAQTLIQITNDYVHILYHGSKIDSLTPSGSTYVYS